MDLVINFVVNILSLLLTLGILVTIHEYGHFWVARRCNVKVERFSIGFGKALYSWRRGETEYRIAALPLGGYVKMLGEQDDDISEQEKHRAFNHKSLWQRSAIVSAGPLANFILAIVLYWFMFMTGVSGIAPVVGSINTESPSALAGFRAGDEIIEIDGEGTRTWQEVRLKLLERLGESGSIIFTVKSEDSTNLHSNTVFIDRWLADTGEPNLLASLGITPFRLDIPVRIGQILPGEPAESSGLLPGDLVTSVAGQPITGWLEWIDIIRENPEVDLDISVLRNNSQQTLTLRPKLNTADGVRRGYIGAGVQEPEVWPTLPPEMTRDISYSIFSAIPKAFNETWDNIVFVLDSMKKMLIGLISIENLSGPITIAQIAGQTVSYGLEYYINFLAVLSISLGVLNLLPIPVLDGGHLFYYLIEAIIRRPVPEKIQAMGMQFGVLLIAGIMFLAFYNDLNRLF